MMRVFPPSNDIGNESIIVENNKEFLCTDLTVLNKILGVLYVQYKTKSFESCTPAVLLTE